MAATTVRQNRLDVLSPCVSHAGMLVSVGTASAGLLSRQPRQSDRPQIVHTTAAGMMLVVSSFGISEPVNALDSIGR